MPFLSPMHESEVAQLCPTLSDPMDCSLVTNNWKPGHLLPASAEVKWDPRVDVSDKYKLASLLHSFMSHFDLKFHELALF